jgi:dipeptidase D
MSQSTENVLKWFQQLSAIPRKSGQEKAVREWLISIATQHGWSHKTDRTGNVLLGVPATKGMEQRPTLVVQGHMDMVCEKTPDNPHDFYKDPIKLIRDGDWLMADRTTLGSDNGIAIALSLALCFDKDVAHPALELLFTVDEETGLTGALNLEAGFISGKILLNVDSEDEGVLTVGCAGGQTTTSTIPVPSSVASMGSDRALYKVAVAGLVGGHSGVNIKNQRGNAIKLLFRALHALSVRDSSLQISIVKGGTAHNAIPREAEALVVAASKSQSSFAATIKELEATLKKEFDGIETEKLKVIVEPQAAVSSLPLLSQSDARRLIDFVLNVPHGVASMSQAIEGLVETSSNLAKVSCDASAYTFITSQRSSVMSRLNDLTQKVESLARLAGGTSTTGDGYPAWEPNWKSHLLQRCKEIYKREFGKDAVVEVIHAGLECGIIGDKYHGMDMISFGPTIKNPHTPHEKLFVPDIDKIYKYMKALFVADLS